MSDKIELLRIEAYQARCPHCHWQTTGESAEWVLDTIKRHINIACPNNPDAVKSWSYEARASA